MTKFKKGDLVKATGTSGRLGMVAHAYESQYIVKDLGQEWVSEDEYDIVITADNVTPRFLGSLVRVYGTKGWELISSAGQAGTLKVGDMVKVRDSITDLMTHEQDLISHGKNPGVVIGYLLDSSEPVNTHTSDIYNNDNVITTHDEFIPRPAKILVYWGDIPELRPEYQFDLEAIV